MMLILVCGLPGVGKTTMAKRIADETKSFVLSTDTLRKKIIDDPEYTEREKELVYNLLFEMAEKFLMTGKNVILDGTFYRKKLRDRARKLAERTNNEFIIVEIVCDEKIVKKGMAKRKERGSESDADFEIYKKIKRQFEPIKEKHLVIDTTMGFDQAMKIFTRRIQRVAGTV